VRALERLPASPEGHRRLEPGGSIQALEILDPIARGVRTGAGFFWKSGWAFVLGYTVSGMIQAFVPRARLVRLMGGADLRSVGLATLFGAISSSCSFAALAAARSLIAKGAHFIAGVAFMFASTNLVIELGILIWIFLGWEYVAAEIVGGFVMITISSLLIRLTYPDEALQQARDHVESTTPEEEDDFDWKARITSASGWRRVGHNFVSEWAMVWREILIGFTIAGFVAELVPASVWGTIFLLDAPASIPPWVVAVENALVAPFVAAATFIGSMGNIPLATVLAANGVLFAGIMGFIYSDLIVPPLVAVNAKYYGWRTAIYIAGIMYVSMVSTALLLHLGFGAAGLTPESTRAVESATRFGIDYTFWLNVASVLAVGVLVRAHRRFLGIEGMSGMKEMEGDGPIKRWAARVAILVVAVGGVSLTLRVAAG
jgi:uncharacterized membrane protein YraQ (UPF0718 family)